MESEKTATEAQVASVVHPEQAELKEFVVAGRKVVVAPLKYRWQALFWRYALASLEAETSSVEAVLKAVADGDALFNYSGELIRGALASLESLPEAAAVILLAQSPTRISPEQITAEITTKAEALRDDSTIEELRALVDAQAEVEKLVQRVGERWPARFEWLLALAGVKNPSDLLAQLSSNLLSKSQGIASGAGA